MITRSKLQLSDKSISDLQLPHKPRKTPKVDTNSNSQSSSISSSVKLELFSSNQNNSLSQPDTTIITMSEADDLSMLEEIQQKQFMIEQKFLEKIPIFHPPAEPNIDQFLAQADDIFDKLKYSDEIRMIKIREKLDESLQPWFIHFQRSGHSTWNEFKIELPNCLRPLSPTIKSDIEPNLGQQIPLHVADHDDKFKVLLDLIRNDIKMFSGDDNAYQWFIQLDLKFSQLKLSFHDRLEIIPYFFVGNAMLWYSLNKFKMHCYTDFCQLFSLEYLQSKETKNSINGSLRQTNQSTSLHSSKSMEHNLLDDPVNCSHDIAQCSNSILSSAISKALIDRFIKDPIKFYGGKDNIFTWIDELEQQFKMMNLCDSDKLSLVPVCLKGEAYQWFTQNQTQLTSWSIFLTEITKSFTSNLKCDLAFKKLKQYHQTLHQSAQQYYTEMIKLMQQADPHMNESTKIQYLINGLRPSLSTETRRNYPKTIQDFLTQVKIAEEITSLNNTFASHDLINDNLTSPVSSSYSNTNNFLSSNNPKDYYRTSNVNNSYYKKNCLPNNLNQQRYLNRISRSTSDNVQQPNDFSHTSPQSNYFKPTSKIKSFDNNKYRNDNSNHQQQHQQSFQNCFKCGSSDHIARYCQHFDQRSQ